MGLTYATANRGACHLRSYTVASEILGIPEKTDPLATEGKPALVKAFQDATAAVDSSGLCVFITFAWTLENIAPQIDAALRGRVDGGAPRRGGRAHLEPGARLQQPGRTREGRRHAAPAPPGGGGQRRSGRGQDAAVSPQMLPEYYELRGWAPDGTLTTQTRDRFGLPG